MEGILKVTPEKLISASGEFANKATQISNLTTEMIDLASSLTSVWEGEASSAYITKFHTLEDDMQKIFRMIQEHSTDLEEMARVFQAAETANIEQANSLTGDVIS